MSSYSYPPLTASRAAAMRLSTGFSSTSLRRLTYTGTP